MLATPSRRIASFAYAQSFAISDLGGVDGRLLVCPPSDSGCPGSLGHLHHVIDLGPGVGECGASGRAMGAGFGVSARAI